MLEAIGWKHPRKGVLFLFLCLKARLFGLEGRTGSGNPSVNELVIEERPGATVLSKGCSRSFQLLKVLYRTKPAHTAVWMYGNPYFAIARIQDVFSMTKALHI